jgi:hypothetical protein
LREFGWDSRSVVSHCPGQPAINGGKAVRRDCSRPVNAYVEKHDRSL